MRSARLRKFAERPIRFRQSIEEPIGVSAYSSTCIEKTVTNEGYFFSDEEDQRFLETEAEAVEEVEAVGSLPLPQNVDVEDIIQDALKQYEDLRCNRVKKSETLKIFGKCL